MVPVMLLLASCMATFPPRENGVPGAGRETGGSTAEAPAEGRPPGTPSGAVDEYEERRRLSIVRQARSLIGTRDLGPAGPVYRRNDCTGFVVGVYRSMGMEVPLRRVGGAPRISELLFRNLRSSRLTFFNARPRVADVVFFKGTIPGNPGRITHVGMVSALEEDGTVEILHYSSTGVAVMHMNLDQPNRHTLEDGRVINDFVRKRPDGYANVPLLAGELFHAYGDLYTFTTLK